MKYLIIFIFCMYSQNMLAQTIQNFSNSNISFKYSEDWVLTESENSIFVKPMLVLDTNEIQDFVSINFHPMLAEPLVKKDFEEMVIALKKNIEYSGYKESRFKSSVSKNGCTVSYFEKPNLFEDAYYTSQIITQKNNTFYIFTLKCKAENDDNIKVAEQILNSITIN